MSGLEQDAEFRSFREFQIALETYCIQTNSRFVIHDCKMIERFNNGKLVSERFPLFLKYKYASVVCERFGRPRHEGKGLRNKESKKNGCGAHVKLSAQRTKQGCCVLRVVKLETKHSNQCEIRRKQKLMKMAVQRKRKPAPPKPKPRIQVKVERTCNDDDSDSDNSLQEEYNYDVKPMAVYSDDEEEKKPVPIFHLNEKEVFPANKITTRPASPPAPALDPVPNPISHPMITPKLEPMTVPMPDSTPTPVTAVMPDYTPDSVPVPVTAPMPDCIPDATPAPTVNEDQTESEDVKPLLPLLPPADKPSLRALLLPAMALNFSQRAIHTET